MLLSLQSLHCVILYCNIGWCVKYGAVHRSCQEWLVAKWLGPGVTVRVRVMSTARDGIISFLSVSKCDKHLHSFFSGSTGNL